MRKILSIVLTIILMLTLLLTSLTFAGGGKEEVVPVQMILDASLSEVSAAFDIPKANLEVARSRAFTFEADKFLLSSIVDKKSKQAYMVSTDAQGKVWIAKPKIEDELIDHISQMKPDETVTVSIWAIYVSPAEELWQIPSKYPAVPFEGYRPALGADVSPEVLAAIEADMTEIKLRAHTEAVQPVVDFLQSTGSRIIYVSKYAPAVDAELSKEDIYNLAGLPEVESISLPNELEPCLNSAAPYINADDVWDEGYDGGGTDGTFGESKRYPYWYQTQVAVVDTGIDFDHPALQHADGGTIPGGEVGSHGTEVAGCIASIDSMRRGIAYGTELLDADYGVGSTYEWNSVKDACDWAHGNYVDLYNFSSRWPTNGQWDNDYCKYFDHIAYEWHKLPICAAGNDGETYEYVGSPGNAFNVLTVGGISDQTNPPAICDFSSWKNPLDGREKPEVCAPAESIVTTEPGGGFSEYPYLSGTSYATPQVTGIVAQLLEQNTDLVYAPELTKAIIMATAINNVYGDPRLDPVEGVGTVDAYAAYRCVREENFDLKWRPVADSFYIEFDAKAGQKVRFVINWLAHTDYNGSGDYGLYADFDLTIKDPYGNTRAYSRSRVNPWEIVQFTAPSSGTYKAWVDAFSFDSSAEWVAAAWCCWDEEDFEWGYDGVTLDINPPPGDVDWTVSTSGSSYAQIDDDTKHSGTRSGRFYMNGSNTVEAYFSRLQPDYIGFYIRKLLWHDAYISAGDGTHRLRVKVNTLLRIYYCDDSGCHWTGGGLSFLWWDQMELRNIDWVAGTYDIYLNGNLIKSGAAMQHSTQNNGKISYSIESGTGNFWIDDILVY